MRFFNDYDKSLKKSMDGGLVVNVKNINVIVNNAYMDISFDHLMSFLYVNIAKICENRTPINRDRIFNKVISLFVNKLNI